MAELGHDVSILTAGPFFNLESTRRVEGRNIIAIPSFPGRKLPFFSDFMEEWAFNIAVQHWLWQNEGRFDVIHVQGRSGFTSAGIGLKTPVVTTFHGLMSVENARSGKKQHQNLSQRVHEWWATRFERRALRRSDACIAVSEEMLHELDMLDPMARAKTRILPNGVDVPETEQPTALQLGASEQLLFVGRLDPIKGVYPLIEAMRRVHPRVRLTMIGNGPERAGLERAIEAAGLGERVQLLGALPQEQVFEQIRRSFALVLPSFHETQGIVLLEANACAVPVVASDIPGIREVVTHQMNGLMAPAGDAEGLSRQINWLFANPQEAIKMGLQGRNTVRTRFSWQHIALETERVYGRLLAEKSRRNADVSRVGEREIRAVKPVYA